MMKTILVVLLSLLASCTARPVAAVQADRDHWTFYRDAMADGLVTQAEADQSVIELENWNAELLKEEKGKSDFKSIAIEVALAIGDDVLRNEGTTYVKAKYPELMPVLDVDANGVISLSDIETMDPREPRTWIRLLMVLSSRFRR